MNSIAALILVTALALPASASSIDSWSQVDIPGHNLTLNYTSSFNVSRNDTLGIYITNGNDSNDPITIYKINVSNTSRAKGAWTGSVTLAPNSSRKIDFTLNITADDAVVGIRVYYNVSSDLKNLSITAYYPGKVGEPPILPVITTWGNSKTNNNNLTLQANTDEIIRFNATANQNISTWNWFKDDVALGNNSDNLNTSWITTGTKTLRMNAANANGTSNTITWTVIVPASHSPAPSLTSWSNSKTNDDNLILYINTGETVKFNVTSDQPISTWMWTLNGAPLINPLEMLTYTFNNEGAYRVAVNGSNSNGNTQTIIWNVTALGKERKKNITILSWYPQVIDTVYVNDTVSETTEYSITTAIPMAVNNWTIDGIPASGMVNGDTYSYTHTWDNESIGFHTIIYRGSDAGSQIEFRWYINVYEINGNGGDSIFDIIDDELENHLIDIKILMFKYEISKQGDSEEFVSQNINRLHQEISRRQNMHKTLLDEFKAGNITIEEYVTGLKLAQKEAKYNMKFTQEMAKIARTELKNEKLSRELENMREDLGEEHIKEKKKVENGGAKGKKIIKRYKKVKDEDSDDRDSDDD